MSDSDSDQPVFQKFTTAKKAIQKTNNMNFIAKQVSTKQKKPKSKKQLIVKQIDENLKELIEAQIDKKDIKRNTFQVLEQPSQVRILKNDNDNVNQIKTINKHVEVVLQKEKKQFVSPQVQTFKEQYFGNNKLRTPLNKILKK